jgi:dTDP-4-dehydrorhamnose reductase
VHFSTDYVFDGSGERPWREDDATKPLSTYGASKLAGELAVQAAGAPHLIVRTSWIYAAQGRNFLRIIARLSGERTELKIVADQFGAPTSAAVIADALVRILDADLPQLRAKFSAAAGLVHLAAAGVTTWHGFATAIVEGLKARGIAVKSERVTAIRTEDYPTKALRPRNSRLALGRLAEIFDVTTPNWATALAPELDQLARMLLSAREGPC